MDVIYADFLASADTLRVYAEEGLVFSATEDRLKAILEYLGRFASEYRDVLILDKVVGNAAALLAVLAGCREIRSPLGSRLASETLHRYGIRYNFDRTVPYIRQEQGRGMCPMERLSRGKDPEQFYQRLKTG